MGPFSLRQVTITIVAILGTAIIGTLATVKIGSTNQVLPVPDPSAFLIGSPIPGLNVGDLAPELSVTNPDGTTTQLTDLKGNPIRLADLRGKAVWLNFWASWCPPCQYETPTLRAMDERYRTYGLAVVGIQVQQIQDDAQQYADRYELRYTIGSDVTGAVFHAYRVFALPTQFFIDANGVIRKIVNGPLDAASAEALIEPILPLAPPAASPSVPATARPSP
ncbi:MAG TPA: TlpA disulfide reductase family protein [Candidatus Dormibacteraeota bacterium]|nr:TlpA disulfide reductase family protein [Candidatus Dormibacteraeota bacterium]